MSAFVLVPVDGGDPVQVPPGETVLGRGPLLGVSDKRVSRHHGLLENLNGRLRLKSTHVNPCFLQASLKDAPRPLDKDRWYPLRHGDLLSLLPGQYLYEVAAAGAEDAAPTPRNSQMFEEDEELPASPKTDSKAPPPIGQDQGQTPPHDHSAACAAAKEEDANSPDRHGNKTDSKEAESNQSTRKRVLPAWMMAAAARRSWSDPKAAENGPSAPAVPSTSKKAGPAKQATPTTTSLSEEAELKEKATTPRKKRQKMNKANSAPSESDVRVDEAAARGPRESSRAAVSDESDGVAMETEEDAKRGETSTADQNAPARTSDVRDSENQPNEGVEAVSSRSEPVQLKARLRTPCPYGTDCYRKNPLHFQECSHPGDTDYDEEEEEGQEADRPECPYGTDCYRKNPLHRKEYRHTKRPGGTAARSARTAASKAAADGEDQDFSEDDSFINDDSEDLGDDSDYAPPDSEDSDKEDIKRLQKEAKAFMTRRTKTDDSL